MHAASHLEDKRRTCIEVRRGSSKQPNKKHTHQKQTTFFNTGCDSAMPYPRALCDLCDTGLPRTFSIPLTPSLISAFKSTFKPFAQKRETAEKKQPKENRRKKSFRKY